MVEDPRYRVLALPVVEDPRCPILVLPVVEEPRCRVRCCPWSRSRATASWLPVVEEPRCRVLALPVVENQETLSQWTGFQVALEPVSLMLVLLNPGEKRS